jgi:MFS family permease
VVGADLLFFGYTLPYYTLEAGRRGAPQSLVAMYMAALPLGGLCVTWAATHLLGRFPASRLARVALLLVALTAAPQGLAAKFFASPPGPFVAFTSTLRFVQGLAIACIDLCAQAMVRIT